MSRKTKTTDQFIQEATLIHGDLYSYKNTKYLGALIKLEIECKEHGSFLQLANSHLKGSGCPLCTNGRPVSTLNSFIEKAKVVHNSYYTYESAAYVKATAKIQITCPVHGLFWQAAVNHLSGCGCPTCRLSKGAVKVVHCLEELGLRYSREQRFDDCVNLATGSRLRYDFYLPTHRLLIEYDGEQHFIPHSFGTDISEETKKINLSTVESRDATKNEYARLRGINLLRIPYYNIGIVQTLIQEQLLKQELALN